MKIPSSLQKFPQPTLIVTSDSIIAKLFLAGGDSFEELDSVAEPRENKQDSEGYFASADESRHGDPAADSDDTARLKTFVKKIVEQIEDLVAHHGIKKIHLIMPAEVEHKLSQEISNQAGEKIGKKIHHDVMKEDAVKILERILND
ncbi:MAG: host attachment protein [Patescibacteria group bacterium]